MRLKELLGLECDNQSMDRNDIKDIIQRSVIYKGKFALWDHSHFFLHAEELLLLIDEMDRQGYNLVGQLQKYVTNTEIFVLFKKRED